MQQPCEYCEQPGQFGLLPAVQVDIEKWGRFGPILKNDLNGEPILDPVSAEPVRAWGSKTVQVLMHLNKFQISAGPKGIRCKKSAD